MFRNITYFYSYLIKKEKKYLLFIKFIIQCIRAMKVIETGQDWKIAALRSSFHVHFLFWRNEIIGVGYNVKEEKQSVLAHAELIAIKQASKKLNNWRLDNCDIYVTLDPCPMCASAIKQARIKSVFSACENSYTKNFDILNSIFKKDSTNSEVNFITNLDVEKSKKILSDFFKKQRK